VSLYLFFHPKGRDYKDDNFLGYNMIPIRTLSLLAYFIYIFIDIIFLYLEEHVMVFWNLLDGRPSRSGTFLGPSESLRGGTLGTNSYQQSSSA
jgi:hypothetical protein